MSREIPENSPLAESGGPVFDDLRPPLEDNISYRRSAVLILLYPREGEDYVVFTRRTDTVEHHKGQISLPGGSQDPTDPDAAFTALREAQEEVGLEPQDVEVLQVLSDVYARVSSFVIAPVVGRLKPEAAERGLVFHPNAGEVAEIIEVPLRALREETAHRMESRAASGVTYNIHYYTYGPYEIWGVTGRIIFEFLNTFRFE